MHNCKQTRNALIDLALGELSESQSAAVMSQLRECEPCRAQQLAISGTLRVSRQALSAAQRPDEFWQRYHYRLRSRLKELRPTTVKHLPRAGFLDVLRAFTVSSVRVPTPAAFAALILVGVLSFAALSRSEMNPVAPTPVARVEIQTVHVPVVQEKIVRQVIYKERKRSKAFDVDYANLDTATATVKPVSVPAGKLNLVGFKPAAQVNLTIIKESDQDEK
ncbi:MAG TPA: zf-HC2 domain-containing protein [Pyrinomonadaceae bacterium]|nr:zf-HC2 domain-containing protein [Pyrinomonadaceae bacterium]